MFVKNFDVFCFLSLLFLLLSVNISIHRHVRLDIRFTTEFNEIFCTQNLEICVERLWSNHCDMYFHVGAKVLC